MPRALTKFCFRCFFEGGINQHKLHHPQDKLKICIFCPKDVTTLVLWVQKGCCAIVFHPCFTFVPVTSFATCLAQFAIYFSISNDFFCPLASSPIDLDIQLACCSLSKLPSIFYSPLHCALRWKRNK